MYHFVGYCHYRICRQSSRQKHERRRKTRGSKRFRSDQRTVGSPTGRCDECLFRFRTGTPIKEAALAGGVEGLYAGLPVIFLVTLGGFLTNAVYCLQQNIANKTMSDYAKSNVWGNNLIFCALAGVLWYMQFFGLEMGKSFLTGSPVLLAFSWCILMALNVTFSNVWGILLKEWKGVSTRTITVLITGLVVLIFSLVFPNLF